MDVEVKVFPPPSADSFAQVRLHIAGQSTPCNLKVDFATLRKLRSTPGEVVIDFLLVASIVYALDRRVFREEAQDAWTRQFSLAVPVAQPELWEAATPRLNHCLSFLTGDDWRFSFTKRASRLIVPLGQRPLLLQPVPGTVSLFSGGLDSLIGVIDHLEGSPSSSLLLVGHHDPRIGSALSEQQRLYKEIYKVYPSRVYSVLPGIGADNGYEKTLRSRSFLFLALGLYVSQLVSDTTPLLIPENGTIALNVPLTPSRVGSCSTRTAHPHYLDQINHLLAELGMGTRILNPLESKTKGECVRECRNLPLLKQVLPLSVSCAKRGHTKDWFRRHTKHCGRCMPCIYRRAALHSVGLDNEIYGRDICTGEVDPLSSLELADDFRACLSFLKKNYTAQEIALLLFENGNLKIERLDEYASTVSRAMDEIRQLLQDKAIESIKYHAGLQPYL